MAKKIHDFGHVVAYIFSNVENDRKKSIESEYDKWDTRSFIAKIKEQTFFSIV